LRVTTPCSRLATPVNTAATCNPPPDARPPDKAEDRRSQAKLPRTAWTRLGACTAAAALLQLDGTLITVALPSVARGLHTTNAFTSLLLTAYFAAYALMLLPGGALVDRLGARRLALLGLCLFAAGAIAGALTSSTGTLLATRIIQGVGAGIVSPAALAGAVSGFPPERRGSALGIWGASAGIANLLGPLLGGLLTLTLGWRADWWAVVPLALVAISLIVRHLPATTGSVRGATNHPASGAVVLAATLVAAITFAVMIGSFYLAEQYLQRAAGYSPLSASTVLVAVALLVGAVAPVAGRLVDRRGERLPAILGFLAASLGLGILAIPAVSLRSAASMVPLVPIGLGLGMLFVATSRAALNATPTAYHGRTSAVLSLGRLVGAAVGATLAGATLAGGLSAAALHTELLYAFALCILVGIPASAVFGGPPRDLKARGWRIHSQTTADAVSQPSGLASDLRVNGHAVRSRAQRTGVQ
jgi:MFS transporter, DHA2 family, methylenomycin A resistance protein